MNIAFTNKFKKQYKLMIKRGLKIELLDSLINDLSLGIKLADKHRDHALTGNFKGYRECHIAPDWLLIYFVDTSDNLITFDQTGTHSDLFI